MPPEFFFSSNLSFISFENWLFVASVSGAPPQWGPAAEPLVGLRGGGSPSGIFLENKLILGAF